MFLLSNLANRKWDFLKRVRLSKRTQTEVDLDDIFALGQEGHWPDGYKFPSPWEPSYIFSSTSQGYWPEGYGVPAWEPVLMFSEVTVGYDPDGYTPIVWTMENNLEGRQGFWIAGYTPTV